MIYSSLLKNANTGDKLFPVPYMPINIICTGVSPDDLEYLYGGTWELYHPRKSSCGL